MDSEWKTKETIEGEPFTFTAGPSYFHSFQWVEMTRWQWRRARLRQWLLFWRR
jgi:hypothetical protein